MTELNEIYRCEVCGNVVEVVHAGVGQLVCCGQPMKKMVENTVDASKEKHVPVVERTEDGILVKVGSVPHPMIAEHYIEWIEVVANGRIMRAHLKPGMAPEARFKCSGDVFTVREYCNLHGLWKA
ncbi:MAG TPA: desulfoferrodoxin [Methanomassiliicoccaceae archaeon]|jgi:superoxide reductase|nr:desulfoferrodoxin [Euryarchaeota archaeon]HOB37881.1 desulfoferrodoxin [Methanomassiliicoccaceae archaeon]HOK27774.1 desulfoferrodoxin [Methanomassiliicoccaceae archaeon]HOL07311.1 desulfoferrodoxin [Methanomassiliicoccaceae archaeon]HOQ27034.1 desulfoferrodoxin [Methanomassiliicoccaceae archaeon]